MKMNIFNSAPLKILVVLGLGGACSFAGEAEEKKTASTPAEVRSETSPAPPHPFAIAESEKRASPRMTPPFSEPEGEPPPPPKDAGRRPQIPRSDKEDRLGGHHRGGMEGSDEMVVLDRLLSMPPDQLARVRRALERIEAMTPEEREELRERLRDFRSISPDQRQEIRERWRTMTPEERREHAREARERRWEEVLNEKNPDEDEAPPDQP